MVEEVVGGGDGGGLNSTENGVCLYMCAYECAI